MSEGEVERLLSGANGERLRASVAQLSGWQPIETAPKDGRTVIVADRNGWVGPVEWLDSWYGNQAGACWIPAHLDEEYGRPIRDLTHWQPLPEPPA